MNELWCTVGWDEHHKSFRVRSVKLDGVRVRFHALSAIVKREIRTVIWAMNVDRSAGLMEVGNSDTFPVSA